MGKEVSNKLEKQRPSILLIEFSIEFVETNWLFGLVINKDENLKHPIFSTLFLSALNSITSDEELDELFNIYLKFFSFKKWNYT